MAIKFGGEFTVKKTPDEVYDFLVDPNRFAPLMPEFRGLTVQDPQHFTIRVNVGVSYIKGLADVKMHLAEADRPHRAQYQGQGNVAGGGTTLVAGFDLAPQPEGTKVAWQGEAQIFGKLTSLAGGLLEPLAKKNVQKLIDGLQAALGGAGEAVAGTAPPQSTVGQAAPKGFSGQPASDATSGEVSSGPLPCAPADHS